MSTEDWVKALIVSGVPRETAEAFMAYHLENPQIWNAFRMLALKKIDEGAKHLGAKDLMERIRHEHEARAKVGFKCDNNFVSYYARIFGIKYKQWEHVFETRQVSGIKEAA